MDTDKKLEAIANELKMKIGALALIYTEKAQNAARVDNFDGNLGRATWGAYMCDIGAVIICSVIGTLKNECDQKDVADAIPGRIMRILKESESDLKETTGKIPEIIMDILKKTKERGSGQSDPNLN